MRLLMVAGVGLTTRLNSADLRLRRPLFYWQVPHPFSVTCPAAARRQWAALTSGDRCSTPVSTAAWRPVLHDAAPIAPAAMTGTPAPPPSNVTLPVISADTVKRWRGSRGATGLAVVT